MRIVSFLVFLSISVWGYDDVYISNAIKEVSKKYNISQELLYTIIDIESGFNPLCLSLVTNKEGAEKLKDANNEDIKIIANNYKDKRYIVSLYPKNIDISKAIAHAFKEQKLSFDVGLAQINSINFKKDEIDTIFEPIFNLEKSAKVLQTCSDVYENTQEIIECYNRGMVNKKSYPYYARFVKSYNKNFGVN